MEEEAPEHDRLKLYVDIGSPIRVQDIAQLLLITDRAFNKYAREEHGIFGARLYVEKTGSGSWWTILVALKGTVDLAIEYPDLFPLFIQNLSSTFHILANQEPAETKEYALDLIKGYAKIGKKLGADFVELSCIIQITLRAEYFDLIESRIDDREASTYKARTKTRDSDSLRSSLNEKAVSDIRGSLQGNGLEASIFVVDGTWYARPVGFEGILLPLKFASSVNTELRNGKTYLINGMVTQSERGFPNSLYAKDIRELH